MFELLLPMNGGSKFYNIMLESLIQSRFGKCNRRVGATKLVLLKQGLPHSHELAKSRH
jgi:hypothetical protein